MSFVDRLYHEIAGDMLTTLTGGIAGERHEVAYPAGDAPLAFVLQRRPVARVSNVTGTLELPDGSRTPYVFGLDDYELAGDELRFLPFGRRPADKSTLFVNYYPRNAEPSGITDVNVGSVARTLVETVAKELAGLYAQLNLAYDSGFLDTATGPSLDRVVALLGLRRFRAGRAVGFATFTRRPGSPGDVTIPAGTPITDSQDTVRYETTETYLMYAGESTAQVRIRGVAESTPVVAERTLTVLARLVAGLSEVTNERGTARATDDESDEDLRLRARGALTAAHEGTVESLRHGLLQLKEVRNVHITEYPNGIAGEILVMVTTADGKPPSDEVKARIEELRPAGVRVVTGSDTFRLGAQVRLTLAGSVLATTELDKLKDTTATTLSKAIAERGIGELVRVRPLAAALLNDPRIVDVVLELGPENGPLAERDVEVPKGNAASLAKEAVKFETKFEKEPAGITRRDVTVNMVVDLLPGTTVADATSAIRQGLETFLGKLTAGAKIDAVKVLDAVRNDAKYFVDGGSLLVTIGSGAEATVITVLGGSYSVGADQSFPIAGLAVDERSALLATAAFAEEALL